MALADYKPDNLANRRLASNRETTQPAQTSSTFIPAQSKPTPPGVEQASPPKSQVTNNYELTYNKVDNNGRTDYWSDDYKQAYYTNSAGVKVDKPSSINQYNGKTYDISTSEGKNRLNSLMNPNANTRTYDPNNIRNPNASYNVDSEKYFVQQGRDANKADYDFDKGGYNYTPEEYKDYDRGV